VPFDFLKRKKPPVVPAAGGAAAPGVASGGRRIPFDGLTEEWRIVGVMVLKGRLSDALNKREPITIDDVRWAPLDGDAPLEPAPGLKAVDPYDLIIVMAGDDTLPPVSEGERAANKVHKVSYDVALEVPPYRVIGTVYLYPGSEPERLLDRSSEMFVPVVEATALHGERTIGTDLDAILVNRFYLRGVEQIDRRTGLKPQKLPGAPLGGTSWQDRSR